MNDELKKIASLTELGNMHRDNSKGGGNTGWSELFGLLELRYLEKLADVSPEQLGQQQAVLKQVRALKRMLDTGGSPEI